MTSDHELIPVTRLLFLGEESLADGFRLIGFEAHPDPSPAEAERIIRALCHNRERTFLIVDERLMAADIPSLKRVRREGGRVLVIAVPALSAPPLLASEVADRLSALFGATAAQADVAGNPGGTP
jgi:vacuolar-type H+-ATPase subunit F/Vma7